jgi:hypothetical protein
VSEAAPEPRPSLWGNALGVVLFVAFMSGALALWQVFAPAQTPPPLQEEPAWRASALANEAAGPYSELWPQLVVERGTLPRSVTHLAAEGSLDGTSALHRPFQRSYFRLEPTLEAPGGFGGGYLRSVYPGPLPAGRPLLTCVGVWVKGSGSGPSAVFEVLAYTESPSPNEARWVFGPPRARNLHAGALRARRAAGEVYLPPR